MECFKIIGGKLGDFENEIIEVLNPRIIQISYN